jgi:hypothetical protein
MPATLLLLALLAPAVSEMGVDRMPLNNPTRVSGRMTIDTDGLIADEVLSERCDRRDIYRQPRTSLVYRNGRALDPNVVPFVVVPIHEKDIHLGDYAVVTYRGRSVLAIVGDRGPAFGEASIATAEALGIGTDGLRGGVEGGVSYAFFPSSGSRPRNQAELMGSLSRMAPVFLAQFQDRSQLVASRR